MNQCLRSIYKISWPNVVSNNELKEMEGQKDNNLLRRVREGSPEKGQTCAQEESAIVTRESIFSMVDCKRKWGRPKATL